MRSGPRLDVERIGRKAIVHNYGHGGSGWSLSWGSSSIAVRTALAGGERQIAVIGCGALGLTSAMLLQRAGAQVTIYAKELPPNCAHRWRPASGPRIRESASHQQATPAFKQLWQQMARTSYSPYQNLLGLPGTPVEYVDNYDVTDDAAMRPRGTGGPPGEFANLQRELIPDLMPQGADFAPGSHSLGSDIPSATRR